MHRSSCCDVDWADCTRAGNRIVRESRECKFSWVGLCLYSMKFEALLQDDVFQII